MAWNVPPRMRLAAAPSRPEPSADVPPRSRSTRRKHLGRRPPREGQKQNAAGVDAAGDKDRHAVHQRGRFARSGAGDNQQWPATMSDRNPLLVIQVGQNGF